MPSGQTPHTITVYAHGNLVESVQPGDRVTLTGIYRCQSAKVSGRGGEGEMGAVLGKA